MRKNGFTLVEMITVIAIMIALSAIAFFSISGIVRNSTDKLYKLQINSILDASRTYAVENANMLSDNNEITLCDLKRSSLLENDLKNPLTEEEFDNSLIVRISKNSDGEFDFSFDGVSKMENYHCDLDITVAINGDSPTYVSLGETYVDHGVIVKKKNLTCTQSDSAVSNETNCYYKVTKSGDYQTAITSNQYSKVYSKVGTFKQTYVVSEGSFSSAMTRTIVVQDKTPPNIYVSDGSSTYNKPFSVRIVEGETVNFSCSATDNVSSNISCVKVKDEYNSTNIPGTYEIIYSATDAAGNSSTLLGNVVVLSKNKSLIVGINVSNTWWTNEDIEMRVFPLYSSECSEHVYSFDDQFYRDEDTRIFDSNGSYKIGIKCKNKDIKDVMIYKITNIDKSAPVFTNGGSVYVTSDTGTLIDTIRDGMHYYYSNDSVIIGSPYGAIDEGSGVANYEIYVNDQLFEGSTLSGDGKYEIKIAALDHANNKSDLVTVAYVIISTAKPTCVFPVCNNSSDCRSGALISGDYISYGVNGYKVTTNNFNPPISISFKFNCTYEYFDGEESIYETTNIPIDKFTMVQENGRTNTINVNSVVNNVAETETIYNDGKWTKTNHYTVTLTLEGMNDIANLHLKPNALCDRLGNCNLWEVVSMPLWNQ